MLLFYSTITEPDQDDKKRFERIKQKIGKEFKRLQKRYKDQIFIMKVGENWIAIHQFLPIHFGLVSLKENS